MKCTHCSRCGADAAAAVVVMENHPHNKPSHHLRAWRRTLVAWTILQLDAPDARTRELTRLHVQMVFSCFHVACCGLFQARALARNAEIERWMMHAYSESDCDAFLGVVGWGLWMYAYAYSIYVWIQSAAAAAVVLCTLCTMHMTHKTICAVCYCNAFENASCCVSVCLCNYIILCHPHIVHHCINECALWFWLL